MDIDSIISGVIWKIKPMFQPELWNIKDEKRLAEHIAANNDLWGDEWVYAARELIEEKALPMTAREFFNRGAKQASFLDADWWKPKTAIETILKINPEFLFSDFYTELTERQK
jgi:hypothetical protein